MPLDAPAIMLMVPVGAIVVGAEFRIGDCLDGRLYTLPSHAGKFSLCLANSIDARCV